MCRVAGLLVLLLAAGTSPAIGSTLETAADQPAALLLFPKVVVDGTRDTVLQLSNASGATVHVRCFYTNPSTDRETGEPVWLTVNFRLRLTPLQPTVWVASEGRPVVPPDRPLELEPGPVPPLATGFLGELRCVAVDAEDRPVTRNVLTGNATIVDRARRDVLRYQAIGIRALPKNNEDGTLLLNDVEYTTCPRVLLWNHFFEGALDPVLLEPVSARLTVVPCSVDYERDIPGVAFLQFDVVNEFEQRLSASLFVECFADVRLSEIDAEDPTRSVFHVGTQGTLAGQTRIRPVPDGGTTAGHGIVAVGEQIHGPDGPSAAANLHFIGGNLQGDVVVLPRIF
ncbi:MAG: hypothetical protein KatS3mg076_2246 [Candidatus Binatia bacterium]|nr:MAG: hypothetical protein KatS3mg076_2246 [Candidatus Binatia bacterium]